MTTRPQRRLLKRCAQLASASRSRIENGGKKWMQHNSDNRLRRGPRCIEHDLSLENLSNQEVAR